MKKLNLILKGILLYTTVFAALLFLCSIDGLYDEGYLIYAILVIAGFSYTCYKTITKEELNNLLF